MTQVMMGSSGAPSSNAVSSANPANVQELSTSSNPVYINQKGAASMLIGEYG